MSDNTLGGFAIPPELANGVKELLRAQNVWYQPAAADLTRAYQTLRRDPKAHAFGRQLRAYIRELNDPSYDARQQMIALGLADVARARWIEGFTDG